MTARSQVGVGHLATNKNFGSTKGGSEQCPVPDMAPAAHVLLPKIALTTDDQPPEVPAGPSSSVFTDVDNSLGKGLWGFLRQIVTDAARDDPVPWRDDRMIGPGRAVVGLAILIGSGKFQADGRPRPHSVYSAA
jgi:hypothetical protein